jgi:alkanesulfonate monooxygenase SsuD/methylene tetrahydromethanopterin reductase-like flavin-dependent oxidoreductase (luciferase family)
MSPLGFMPPFGDDAERLRQVREYEALLQREWRLANTGRHGEGTRDRAGRLLQRSLIGPARKLVAIARASRPKVGLKVRHSQPGC